MALAIGRPRQHHGRDGARFASIPARKVYVGDYLRCGPVRVLEGRDAPRSTRCAARHSIATAGFATSIASDQRALQLEGTVGEPLNLLMLLSSEGGETRSRRWTVWCLRGW